MSKSITSRRGFLGLVAGAVPLAIAAPVPLPGVANPPAAPPADPFDELSKRKVACPYGHVHPAIYCCDCKDCLADHDALDPLMEAAVIATYKAMCALEDLTNHHKCDEDCRRCTIREDADSMLGVMNVLVCRLESELCGSDAVDEAERLYRDVPSCDRPPFEADFLEEAALALADLLGALKTLQGLSGRPGIADDLYDVPGFVYVVRLFIQELDCYLAPCLRLDSRMAEIRAAAK